MRKRDGSKTFFRQDFLGERLNVFDGDNLSRGWYGHGWAVGDRTEFDQIAQLAARDDCLIFNLGAHQGVIALLLKRIIAPNGRVVAVEMDSFNAECIRKNVKANRESNIIVWEAALSNKSGYAKASGGSNNRLYNGGFAFLAPNVKTISFGDLCSKCGPPDIVYCDIEGAEVVLFLSDYIFYAPVLFIEMHGDEACKPFGYVQSFVIDRLKEKGYRLFASIDEQDKFVNIQDFCGDITKRFFLIAHQVPKANVAAR